MKNRPQCKDLSTEKVLRFLAGNRNRPCTWFSGDGLTMPSVGSVFPDAPPRLVHAKLRGLVCKGLVDGCMCGCRGDFAITKRGLDRLKELTNDAT